MNRTELLHLLRTGFLGLFMVLAGVARADDTDVYLSGTGVLANEKPDILIIFDNSGSMGTTVVGSGQAYNPATTYTGNFLDSKLYWSNSGTPANNATGRSYSFDKANNRCALSLAPLATSGSFQSGRIARWRPSNSTWLNLSTTDNTPPHVDCKADWDANNPSNPGIGDGYPRNGASGPYTATKGPVNVWKNKNSPRLYTANYLNWYYSPDAQNKTRMQIAIATVVNLLQSTTNVRWGLMTFNYNNQTPHGGRVVKAMGEGDTHVTEVVTIVNGLTPEGYTPLSETMWEAYRYYAGKAVDYGDATNPTNPVKDSAAQANGLYLSPFQNTCQKAFVIYMTDGAPTNDIDADGKIQTLIGGNCTGSGNGKCLDDLAAHMYNNDIYDGKGGIQSVITYTIGFTVDHPLLAETAQRGGGKYYTANTATELTSAFQNALSEILSINTSFAAPSLSVNAFNKLYHRNSIYLSLFKPEATARWNGNVKKLNLKSCTQAQVDAGTCDPGQIIDANNVAAVDPATKRLKATACSVWSNCSPKADGSEVTLGGAGGKVPARAGRTLFTYTDAAAPSNVALNVDAHKLVDANTALTFDMLGLTHANTGDPVADAATDVAARTARINWLRGQDLVDEDEDSDTTEDRWKFGDVMHSRMLPISYGGTNDSPIIKLFVGTNDGTLRMINESTGVEEWAFIPQELLSPLQNELSADANGKHFYGLDGTPTAWVNDIDGDGVIEPDDGDFVRIFIGMRRGGNNIYAFDVTPDDSCTLPSKICPKYMWQIKGSVAGTDFAKLAQTWSAPKVARIRHGTTDTKSEAKSVLIFGGGYDVGQDDAWGADEITTPPENAGKGVGTGNAIYIVDPADGSRLWWASAPGSGATLELANMNFSIPSDVAFLDANGDGETDRLYVGDTGGQLWRIDLGTTLKLNVNGGSTGARLAVLADGNEAANKRKFFYPPDVAQVTDPTFSSDADYDLLTIGSGDREDPLNKNTVQDRLYAIRDYTVVGAISEDPDPVCTPENTSVICTSDLYNATANTIQDGADDTAKQAAVDELVAAKGWYINLSFVGGEKSLAGSLILDGVAYYTAYLPADENANNTCEPQEGVGRLYAVNALNATAVFEQTGDATLNAADRVQEVAGGIPPEPVPIFLDNGDVDVDVSLYQTPSGLKRQRVKTFWYQK
ncbi:MAG: hypothetical protein A2150_06725 [Candidatus Muproteobacteria bacterium RBG_16_64_11]|uniref:Uncharacterized protein n=1 Tax=Candidatus Muproteobacteria bacterium RBG_16_64_11 TaxID=1817758 RepID=A0A1F6TE12_9PROT|nr:MAG: hypothetical protein A2150_06725 [Candidatus Muproteobacteria bacterium RBG_16_64_11]